MGAIVSHSLYQSRLYIFVHILAAVCKFSTWNCAYFRDDWDSIFPVSPFAYDLMHHHFLGYKRLHSKVFEPDCFNC